MFNNKADARLRDRAQAGMSEWLRVYVCLSGFVGFQVCVCVCMKEFVCVRVCVCVRVGPPVTV